MQREVTEPTPLAVAGLTAAESDFVYNTEVLGLPVRKAAEMAGVSLSTAYAPHLTQARQTTRALVRESSQITKDDIVHGMHDAVGRAKLLGEPMVELVGWEKIAKLLGYDTPAKININLTASVDVLRQQVRQMSDDDLVRAVGAGNVLDGDFFEIKT